MSSRQNLRKFLVNAAGTLLTVPGGGFSRRVRAVLREALERVEDQIEVAPTQHGPIKFFCPTDLTRWRALTLLDKEPETIEWIDAFDSGDVFWDIGANVGVYTLYAARAGKARVLAFEPSAANYLVLNRNIQLNGFWERATAYCLAMADADAVGQLHMQSTEFGGALSSFDDPVDHNGDRFTAAFLQGMVGFSIDSFIERFQPPFPNRLKIDVDGIEDKIVAGAGRTLADPRLKALSIELDEARPDYTGAILEAIGRSGMKLAAKKHAPMFDGSPYANIFNYQFTR